MQKTLEVLEQVRTTLTLDYLSKDQDEQNRAYTKLIMKETEHETTLRESIENTEQLDEAAKKTALKGIEEGYYMRRLVNAEYFKRIKLIHITNDFV